MLKLSILDFRRLMTKISGLKVMNYSLFIQETYVMTTSVLQIHGLGKLSRETGMN